MADLRPGDRVFGSDGKPTRVTWVSETHHIDCFRVTFSDGTEVVTDSQHKWLVESKTDRKSNSRFSLDRNRVVTTPEMLQGLGHNGERNYSVLVAKPVEYPKKDLPLDPYLLGCWLGDGSSSGGAMTGVDPEIFEAFYDAGFKAGKTDDGYTRSFLGLRAVLKGMGLLLNKHVPEEYLYSAAEDRLSLLQGLMDTDGYISPGGHAEFCNTNLQIAESVLELVQSLGMKATMLSTRAKLRGVDHGPKYRVKWTPTLPVFRLQRKLSRVKTRPKGDVTRRFVIAVESVPSVPTRCISVEAEDRLFLCTRAFIPTHNSEMGAMLLIPTALKGFPVAWYAPTYGAMQELWRLVLHTIPQELIETRNSQDFRLVLKGGGVIEFWAIDSDPDASRGRKYKMVVIDEAAKSRHLQRAWGYVIAATLLDYQGQAWFLSTPAGKNFFFTLAERGRDPERPNWTYYHAPTIDNPYIHQSEVDMLKGDLSEHEFRQEILAEFLEGVGIFFGDFEEDKHTCVPYEVPPHWNYIGGYDDGWASPACFLLMGIDHSGGVHVIDEWYGTHATDPEKAQHVLNVIQRNGLDRKRIPIYADTSVWGAVGRAQGLGVRPVESFWSQGLQMVKASKDRKIGWAKMRAHIRRAGGFEIFKGRCPNLINEMLHAVTDEKNIEDLDTDQSDHALDACRYAIMQHHAIPADPLAAPEEPEPDYRPAWLKNKDKEPNEYLAGTADEPMFENSAYI